MSGMQSYLDQITDIAQNPTSNLVVAALLLAAVTLVVLILILVALIFLVPSRRDETSDDADGDDAERIDAPKPKSKARRKSRPRRKPLSTKTQVWLFAGIAFATATTAYGVTSTNDYCANTCHVMENSVSSWNEAPHASIPCVRCHEGRLIVSLPTATVSRVRHLTAELAGNAPRSAVVPSRVCMGCHEAQLEGSIETSSGIIVSHAEPLEAGISCDTCHDAVAHARETASRATIMTTCLGCHDGTTAAAECATCHVGDIGASPVFDRIYPTTELPVPTCGGCHSEASCDDCHGIRMPHSVAFVEGEHARDAGFARKKVCWNCHVETECFACHGDFDNSHPEDFFEDHKKMSRQAACDSCHQHHEGPFCNRCH